MRPRLSDKIPPSAAFYASARRYCQAARIVLLIALSSFGQDALRETFTLGKKVSPYAVGLEPPPGCLLGYALFLKTGMGYETNVYQSPYHFDDDRGGSNSQQFLSYVNMPRSDMAFSGNGGVELVIRPSPTQYARLMLAGQLVDFREENLRDGQGGHAYAEYRNDLSRLFRLDLQLQGDYAEGKSYLIFGSPAYSNLNEFINGEGMARLTFNAIPPTIIGRGRIDLSGFFRYRDYQRPDGPVRIPSDTALYFPSTINDSLEGDYWQARGRVRYFQGLVRGWSLQFSADLIKRNYLELFGKMTAPGFMAVVPLDTIGVVPPTDPSSFDTTYIVAGASPLRSQWEYRGFGGVQFSPPHFKRSRVDAGVEFIRVEDPYQGFYGYRQWALKAALSYRPSPLSHTSLGFAVKNRMYDKLKANLWLGDPARDTAYNAGNHVVKPDVDNGVPVRVWADSAWQFNDEWKSTLLERTMIEAGWMGQVQLLPFLALWGSYRLEAEISNRLMYEYLDREFVNQAFGAGITVAFERPAK